MITRRVFGQFATVAAATVLLPSARPLAAPVVTLESIMARIDFIAALSPPRYHLFMMTSHELHCGNRFPTATEALELTKARLIEFARSKIVAAIGGGLTSEILVFPESTSEGDLDFITEHLTKHGYRVGSAVPHGEHRDYEIGVSWREAWI